MPLWLPTTRDTECSALRTKMTLQELREGWPAAFVDVGWLENDMVSRGPMAQVLTAGCAQG